VENDSCGTDIHQSLAADRDYCALAAGIKGLYSSHK